MSEKVGVELEVETGKAEKGVKSFKAQLREATAELIRIQGEFGDISPEAQKAAQAVAEMRDRLKDANEVASLFDPEKKFQAIVGVTSGIASGFAAAQGAMALFGVESKEVEQALLKVQAATAFAQGLSGVKAAVEDFKRLGGVIKNTTAVQTLYNFVMNGTTGATVATTVATTGATTAMRVFRTALLATGLGAIVLLLVVAAEKFDVFGSKAKAAADAQKEFNSRILESDKSLRDQLLSGNKDAEALLIARAKAEGKSEADITAIHKRAAEDRLRVLKEHREKVKDNDKEFTEANNAVQAEVTAQDVASYEEKARLRKEDEDKQKEAAAKAKALRERSAAERKADLQKIAELDKQLADEAFKRTHTEEETAKRLATQKFDADVALKRKYNLDTKLLEEDYHATIKAIEDKYRLEREDKEKERLEKAKEAREKYDAAIKENLDKQFADESQYAEARKRLAEEEKETKIRAAQAVSSALSSFSELAGEQTAAGKAFAVAAATIQAILGAQQAFTSLSAIPIVGPALGAIAAAGAIAAGIANVRKILAVQVPGKGAGGGAPSISAGAPITPGAPQQQSVKIDQQQVNSMGNATVKAFVVESDITTKQDRIRRIQNAAKFK